jgi:methylthioribose-1-phosphate isomerase
MLNDKRRTPAILWDGNTLSLLDQRLLPAEERYLTCEDAPSVAAAIRDMVVRGAPAIGISAAYGVVLSSQQHGGDTAAIHADIETLSGARPTARNLFWALEAMSAVLERNQSLRACAEEIHRKDIANNEQMGQLGCAYLHESSGILTHCNAGALATGGYGTALGVVRAGWAAGRVREVFADETRPWLQGARLTAWELMQAGIDVTVLADGAAAWLMRQGKINWLIVGADRVAANGDVANKIGTYQAAIAARFHGVKVMVVAPMTTVDFTVAQGGDIAIEQRAGDEILACGGTPIAPQAAKSWNPVFDVTPADLVDVLVTDDGVVEHPTTEKMATLQHI